MLTNSRLLAATLLACLSLLAVTSPAADYIQMRGGLPRAFRKFAASQQTQTFTKITFFGGSITEGAGASQPQFCYRELLLRHFRTLHPGAVLAENNSAIGGTGSWLGAFRTKNDAMYGGAALVIVEFAVNDGDAPEEQVYASMEGIVRQIIARDSTADMLFVYTLAKHHLDAYQAGRLPDRVQWHEKIAEHYGIPSVNMAQYAAQKILAGELKFDEFAPDGVHPSDKGYALYFEALKPFLATCLAEAKQASAPPRHTLPKPFSPAPMEKAQCVPYEWAKFDGAWKLGQRSPSDRFLHVATGDQAGATLRLKFKGAAVGYFDVIGPNTGDFEFSIDGGPWQLRTNFDIFCRNSTRAHARPLAQGLAPDQWHELQLRIAEKIPAESHGRAACLGYLLVDGEVVDPCQGADALARIDAIYAGMEPLKYTPPATRWRHLDKTLQKLREGGTLRIVMLGDSIVNDTSSSQFELLLQRLYPKCKVAKVTSVRGSTGCWWYKDENRVDEWVLKHQPDLLMIGGISQREDIDAIRSVIQQVRAQRSLDILLMTPAFGVERDPHFQNWTYDVDPNGQNYRARLLRLAADERCGFVDMTGPWWQYVQDSGKDYGWFRRDAVHANERGFQILGRILEKFFAP